MEFYRSYKQKRFDYKEHKTQGGTKNGKGFREYSAKNDWYGTAW